MNYINLAENKVINDWLRAKRATENTRKSYLTAMQLYTEFTGVTPDELIDEAEAEQIGAASIPMRKRKIHIFTCLF